MIKGIFTYSGPTKVQSRRRLQQAAYFPRYKIIFLVYNPEYCGMVRQVPASRLHEQKRYIAMESFDKRYQARHNGPLTAEVRARLNRFREDGSTLKDIGDALGISGAFVSKLLNPKDPANISTKHIPRIIKTLEHHEQTNGYAPKKEQADASSSKFSKLEDLPLEDLIRAISAKGFDVSVTPRAVR